MFAMSLFIDLDPKKSTYNPETYTGWDAEEVLLAYPEPGFRV